MAEHKISEMARFPEPVPIWEPSNLLAEDDSVQNQQTENFKFCLKIERTEGIMSDSNETQAFRAQNSISL